MLWQYRARGSARAFGLVLVLVATSLGGASGCADLDDDDPEDEAATGGTSTGGVSNAPTGGRSTGGVPATQTGGTPGTGNDVADEYVRAHNEVRAAVEEPPNYPGTWQPLPPVTWSEEVAASAKAWAQHLADDNGCDLEHASNTGYGENLAGSSGSLDPARAVELWAREGGNYSFEPKYRFDSATGHYTQIVWRSSVEIGCGSARCGSATVVCCRYSPQGNFIGRQPY